VLIAEFDVETTPASCPLVGRRLSEAPWPDDSRVALIIRDGRLIAPKGDTEIRSGDRVLVMGTPAAAHRWSLLLAPGEPAVEDVLIYGAGRVGGAIARELLDRGKRVRIVERDADAARRAAALLPDARVHHSTGFDRGFLQQERLDRSDAAIAATGDDARSLFALVAAAARGVRFTVGIVDDPVSTEVYEQAGVDVTVNPRRATAEELIRFAHDPRTRQVSMLDDDRFDVIDILVRPDGAIVDRPLRELPQTSTVIGAIVRDGRPVFPHADERLRRGDRVIVVVDPARAAEVERAL
jgi:trk system potassium uptake protein TrkA